MAMSLSGVISPPGTRGTTEYVPSFCMLREEVVVGVLQRRVSRLSTNSFQQEARIEADRRLADVAAEALAVLREHGCRSS